MQMDRTKVKRSRDGLGIWMVIYKGKTIYTSPFWNNAIEHANQYAYLLEIADRNRVMRGQA
jgi:hypothetical protein